MKLPTGGDKGPVTPTAGAAGSATQVSERTVGNAVDRPVTHGPALSADPGIVQKGLIDVPPSPDVSSRPVAVASRQIAAPFDSFMKVRTFEVDIQRPGVDSVETVKCDILSGPGHNCSMAAPLILDENGHPAIVLKAGDTRAARKLRGQDYVKLGMIGGRWDKVGADPQKIGLEEIAEEIGADLLPGGFLSLGDKLVPTMPGESTEADRYFAAIVRIDADDKATGDHGGMEVVGLMKPITMPIGDAIAAMDDGRVGEGARARVAYQRALDVIGFVPELDAYVHDLPGALKKRFDTLGLGALTDPRNLADAPDDGPAEPKPTPAALPKAANVNDVAFVSQNAIDVSADTTMIDAKTTHLARSKGGSEQVGDPFPNQIFHVAYDRAKIATFFNDPMQGPMVRLDPVERPVMAAKGLSLDDERTYKDENVDLTVLDVGEIKVDLDGAKGAATDTLAATAVQQAIEAQGVGGKAARLGAACDASPGQSDLRYHFFSNEVQRPSAEADRSAFVPLAEAIAMCRGGEGDAATEALLMRLATAQAWIPSLGMPIERARKMAGQ